MARPRRPRAIVGLGRVTVQKSTCRLLETLTELNNGMHIHTKTLYIAILYSDTHIYIYMYIHYDIPMMPNGLI